MIKYDNLTKFSSEAEYKAAKEQLPYPQVSISNNENKINFEPHYPADGKLAVLKQDRVNWTDEDIEYFHNNAARFNPSLTVTPEDISATQAAYGKFEALPDKSDTDLLYCGNDFKYAPNIDTSMVTNMGWMFPGCSSLTTIPQLDTRNVTMMSEMFYECTSLTTIPQLDTRNVTDMDSMFDYCTSLTTLGGFTGLKCDLDLSSCYELTKESILNVLREAADVKAEPKTLTLGQINLDKLTPEDKKIAINKGWVLS